MREDCSYQNLTCIGMVSFELMLVLIEGWFVVYLSVSRGSSKVVFFVR